jgi:hypothetical protein
MIDEYSPEPTKRERNNRTLTIGDVKKSGSYTMSHTSMMAYLNRQGIRFLSEQEFIRPNEYRANGSLKTYTLDILITDPRFKNVAIEVEGKGSASKDNERRDAFFLQRNIDILHFGNKDRHEAILSALEHYKLPEGFP